MSRWFLIVASCISLAAGFGRVHVGGGRLMPPRRVPSPRVSSTAEDTETTTQTVQTPFQIFQDHVSERIAKADQQGFDQLANDISAEQVLRPIVSWAELERLTSCTESTMEERFHLAQQFALTGNYLVLELDEDQESLIRDMWWSLEKFFASDSIPESELHHQAIPREGESDEHLGYRFVQTYNTPQDVILPTTIQDLLGNSARSQRGVAGSFQELAQIASTVAVAVSAGALQQEPEVMQRVMDGLLHSNSTRFASANHRLSRYILTDADETGNLKESLRAHTDWTLITPIPLSATPGLQLWNPRSEQWIAPESLVQELPSPRTRYVVVLAGKWMELLTNQAVQACIHRVVLPTSQEPRLSAPFFLRPLESVFTNMNAEFNDPHGSSTMTTSEATARIHSMFQRLIDKTKEQKAVNKS